MHRFPYLLPTLRLTALQATLLLVSLAMVFIPQMAAGDGDLPKLIVPNRKAAVEISLPLPSSAGVPDGETCVLEEIGKGSAKANAQWRKTIVIDGTAAKDAATLVAVIPPGDGSTPTREFRVKTESSDTTSTKPAFSLQPKDEATLTVLEGERPVLAYNNGIITGKNVPKKEFRRHRAAYVHPIWGLDGEVLTDDFPHDHYHHHGLFWSWPHVSIGGNEYDLWMGRNIRHQFVKWLARETGPAAAVLGVENGWFVGRRKVMIERVWLTAFKAGDNSQSVDVRLTWIPVERPVSLLGAAGKSYGGLSLRYNKGPKSKPTITVPRGVTKDDLKIARLPWADFTAFFPKPGEKITGDTPRSGATLMVDPGHPDYPPTWLTRRYGILCIGWPGVKTKTFQPGKPFSLSYRVWIHRGEPNVKQLRTAYEDYTAGESVAIWGETR